MHGGRWIAVTVDCQDARRVADFYATLFGTASRPVGRPGWYRLGPLVDGGPLITFQPVPERRSGKARVHLDVEVDDLDAAMAQVTGLGGQGPREIHRFPEGKVAVMTDPEGTEFCLVALAPGAALA